MQGERKNIDEAAWQNGIQSLNTLGNINRNEGVVFLNLKSRTGITNSWS